jgi:hypothetical protein
MGELEHMPPCVWFIEASIPSLRIWSNFVAAHNYPRHSSRQGTVAFFSQILRDNYNATLVQTTDSVRCNNAHIQFDSAEDLTFWVLKYS